MGNAVTNARDYFEIVFDNWDEYYPFLNNLSDEKKTQLAQLRAWEDRDGTKMLHQRPMRLKSWFIDERDNWDLIEETKAAIDKILEDDPVAQPG